MTTKIEAVNEVLAGIGEAPVNSLGTGFVTAETAAAKIDAVSREVQERGWFFNTEDNYPLPPDTDGHILLPQNILRVDQNSIRPNGIVQRGKKLYDTHAHSYKFTKTLKVTIVIELPFEDLPEAAQWYITLRAKRLNQADFLGAPELYQMQTPDEVNALTTLKQMESEAGDYNIFDNYDLADWISRDLL